jgi:hypothetical protein
MTDQTAPAAEDAGARAACLQRLATALCGYPDLSVSVREEGPAPCLAVRNTATPHLSETVAMTEADGQLNYTWSWGEPIAGTSDPDAAAHVIAYVLQASGVSLEGRR